MCQGRTNFHSEKSQHGFHTILDINAEIFAY